MSTRLRAPCTKSPHLGCIRVVKTEESSGAWWSDPIGKQIWFKATYRWHHKSMMRDHGILFFSGMYYIQLVLCGLFFRALIMEFLWVSTSQTQIGEIVNQIECLSHNIYPPTHTHTSQAKPIPNTRYEHFPIYTDSTVNARAIKRKNIWMPIYRKYFVGNNVVKRRRKVFLDLWPLWDCPYLRTCDFREELFGLGILNSR